jgi:hypothetical protein
MRNVNHDAFSLTSGDINTYSKKVESICGTENAIRGSGITAIKSLANSGNGCHGGTKMERSDGLINSARHLALKIFFLPAMLLVLFSSALFGQTKMIRDEYWGGKTKFKKDFLGQASDVKGMEVTADDEKITVTITGPFFYNYVHHLKGADKTPPGDLYVSSSGWKVKGKAPYTEDTFTKDEGWDYVVSLFDKSVYKLDWSKIQWTRPKPGSVVYRRDQAWRGGYGEFVSWADVKLTDKSLVISFPFTALLQEIVPAEVVEGTNGTAGAEGSEGTDNSPGDENMLNLGLHWTMMCGNDIVEGEFALPAIIYSDDEEAETIIIPRPTPYMASQPPSMVPWGADPKQGTVWWPGSDDHHHYPPPPPHDVPEPSTILLLLVGLAGLGFPLRARKE